jgi:hypothetical protein
MFNDYEQRLVDHIKSNLDKPDFFVCGIAKISVSGMTRQVKVGIYFGGKLMNISALVAKVTGWKYTNKGDMAVKVSGCGMDMIFHTLDCFTRGLGIPDGYKQPAVQHYTYF